VLNIFHRILDCHAFLSKVQVTVTSANCSMATGTVGPRDNDGILYSSHT